LTTDRLRIRMTPEEVTEFLAGQRKVHVATINRDGTAHLVPMYFLLVDGQVAFWTYRRSQKVQNLRRDPRVTVMAESGEAYFDLRGVQLSGRAHLSDDVASVSAFGERLFERIFGAPPESSRETVARQAPKRTLVTVEPLRVVSWDHSRL
jgi:PPOX class probable F420-dependent enzyme